METRSFKWFVERLRRTLECAPRVLGLVTLGTTADAALRDDWSDHDFWVITEPGAQDAYLDDLAWLPAAESIVILVCHGRRYRTALYRDHHKVEFAVLDVEEARQGKIERYNVLIDRGAIGELAESIRQRTLEQALASASWSGGLQNLCVLVWAACERYGRGEMLSARQYLHGFAVNQLLQLVSVHSRAASSVGADALDPRRRLEMRAPGLAAEVLGVLDTPIPVAALGLLGIAEREVKANAPDLGWEDVAMVQRWIADLAAAMGGLT